ncbi:MAG: hypothetical protein AMXMBFR64_61760 [Myxococcales bacterium]
MVRSTERYNTAFVSRWVVGITLAGSFLAALIACGQGSDCPGVWTAALEVTVTRCGQGVGNAVTIQPEGAEPVNFGSTLDSGGGSYFGPAGSYVVSVLGDDGKVQSKSVTVRLGGCDLPRTEFVHFELEPDLSKCDLTSPDAVMSDSDSMEPFREDGVEMNSESVEGD